MIDIKRRQFIQHVSSGLAMLGLGVLPASCGGGSNRKAEKESRILVPAGTTPRIIARSNHPVLPGNSRNWHLRPDGGGVMALNDGGWLYVSNSEIDNAGGSVGVLRFDSNANITDYYSILENTYRNCSGTMSPWDTWFSCEEIDRGSVWECDPLDIVPPVQRLALGVFKHESACIDPITFQIYLTEDQPDSRFYRFTPDSISSGTDQIAAQGQLAVASVVNGMVDWLPILDPLAINTETRYQQPASTAFDGAEGITYFDGVFYFTTKGDNRIWAYTPMTEQLVKHIDADGFIDSVDDITPTAGGDLLVAEDGAKTRIVNFPADSTTPLTMVQVLNHEKSEITGLAFNPTQTRLYFNSQRGSTGDSRDGISFELRGDFNNLDLKTPLVEWTLDHKSI
jgi:secreted PhoX family phosphatase